MSETALESEHERLEHCCHEPERGRPLPAPNYATLNGSPEGLVA
jgi:hypothetical protein